ncbi:MAG: KpsF/GutQ family sugar-phosphate isomerase [bacterium]
MNLNFRRKAQEILSIESNSIKEQVHHINNNFWKACEMIYACKGRIVVMGIGKSGIVGRKISATLASTGTPSFFMHPVESLHGDLGMLTPQDIVLALSYSGETAELTNVFPFLKKIQIKLIIITAKPSSKLGKTADVIINCLVKKEACQFNIVPTSSTIAMMALGDALSLIVMEMKGFKKEDFAKLHPGGALGKKLFLTVKDLMHGGKSNPKVYADRKIKEVIIVMTRFRLGATNVINARGKLIGFFTDGDLRRHLQKELHLLDKSVGEVMTENPFTVYPEMLLTHAAQIFKTHKFDNIPVIDHTGNSIGIIDERDLMVEGIT